MKVTREQKQKAVADAQDALNKASEAVEKAKAELKLAEEMEVEPYYIDKLESYYNDRTYSYISSSTAENIHVGLSRGNGLRPVMYKLPSAAAAGLIAKKMNLMQEMHAFAFAMNPSGWCHDFRAETLTSSFGIVIQNGVCRIGQNDQTNSFAFGVYVELYDSAQEMLRQFGSRIEEIYNSQY